MISYGFDQLRLHRITARPLARIDVSRTLLESLGFVHEGTSREARYVDGAYLDEERYALFDREWRDESG